MGHIHAKSLSIDNDGNCLYLAMVFTTSLKEWKKSVGKYLRRHGVDYVCLRLQGDQVAVINSFGEGTILYSDEFDAPMKGAVVPFEAGLDEIFAALDCKGKPISTSTNWRLTVKEEGDAERESEWELVNLLTGQALNEAADKLRKWGVRPRTTYVAGGTTLRFKWPDRSTPGDIAYYEAMLAPITPRLKAE